MPIGEINRHEDEDQNQNNIEEERQRRHDEFARSRIWAEQQNSPEQKKAEEIYEKLNALKRKHGDGATTPEMEELENELNKAVHEVNVNRWKKEEEYEASKKTDQNERKS